MQVNAWEIHLAGNFADFIEHTCAMLMEGVADQIDLIKHWEEQSSR